MIILITMAVLLVLVIIGLRQESDKRDNWPPGGNINGDINTGL
jgi:hypothetical protein